MIVIVIIGILAALVIVAYNGIQQRARNVARINSAKELQKVINAYVVQEGKYPFAATGPVCVGAGYTDWDGDGSLDCHITNSIFHPSAAVDAELRKVAPIPKVETSDIAGSNATYRGYGVYANQTVDGQTGRPVLRYFLDGPNLNCGVPGILTTVSSGVFTTSGASNTQSNYGVTFCYVAIMEP